jgi:hypothetical protein
MPLFTVAGLTLITDLSLPELVPSESHRSRAVDGPQWHVTVTDDRPEVRPAASAVEVFTASGTLWSRLELDPAGNYRHHFPDLVDFYIDSSARSVRAVAAEELAPDILRHLIVDHVVPHLLAIDRALVLHASAVVVDGRAVAFVGPTGAGKSSLAAGFVALRQARLLCDDYLRLREADGGYLADASYPGLRLWQDSAAFFADDAERLPQVASYTDKRRWAVSTADSDDAALAAIVLLGADPGADGPTCRAERVGGRDVFAELFQQTFRAPRASRRELADDMEAVVRLAGAVPVVLVEYRRTYDALAEVAAAIADLPELSGSSAPPTRAGS